MPNSEYFMKSAAEIKAIWKKRADDGTKKHLHIEHFYNNLEVHDESVEFEQFIQFHREYNKFKPYRTEWQIFDEDEEIAGTIDWLGYDKEKAVWQKHSKHRLDLSKTEFVMLDWKRCKKIDKNSFNNEKGLWPINHLPNSNFWKYALQQNFYKYFLKKNYGIKVGKMYLLQVHPTLDNYVLIEVPDLGYEVGELLRSFKKRNL